MSKVPMLSAIAHGKGTKNELSARTGLRPAPDPTSALAVESQRLMHDPAFLDKDNPKHKDVMVRYIALTAQVYPVRG